MSSEQRSHRDVVFDKVAKAAPIEPAVLTTEAIEEVTGEEASSVQSIEVLFTVFGAMPGLRLCEHLQELTIINARLPRIPPELQYVRATLRRLSLPGNNIGCIENLGGMGQLHSLFLHENQIDKVTGLHGCCALQRLWLCSNRITALDQLGGPRRSCV